MTTLNTVLGFDTNDKAKFRFHVLSVFYQGGWKAVKLAFPKIRRATLYRWKKSYEKSGKRLNSLLPGTTKPRHTRVATTSVSVTALIKKLRKEHPRMGKAKIKRFVDQFCTQEGIPPISESGVGRVIKRNNLFFAGKGEGRRKRQSQTQRERVKFCPKAQDMQPGYIQLDGVKFYYLGRYYYFLTAVDIASKQAWVKMVTSFKSKHAASFLEEILQTSWYTVHTIHTDNGSEFLEYFDQAIQKLQIKHLFSYPKRPKTNGFVERFNWTIQDEFLFDSEDFLLYPEEFQQKLSIWLVWYNETRPHQSLAYLSPYQYLQKRRFVSKVLN